MRVAFFAPSYKRPIRSSTQKLYPFVKLVVRESEADEYREAGNDIAVVPDSAQGNLCRVRNHILDNLWPKAADCVVLLDDDNTGIYRWERQRRDMMDSDEFMQFAEGAAQLCRDSGLYLWGVNCVPDKGAYREHTPFGFLQYIGGPFQAHMKGSEIRYDEKLPLKEDYDITLQHIHRYGGCLRVNYVHYANKQSEQPGGCATYRNLEREKEQFALLQKKWGSDVVRQDKGSKRSFDYNPIIHVPIKGV